MATTGSEEPEAARREQVRYLLDRRSLVPDGKVWGGPSKGTKPCFVCAVQIPEGEYEFELESSTGSPILCRLCYAAWDFERTSRPPASTL